MTFMNNNDSDDIITLYEHIISYSTNINNMENKFLVYIIRN